MTKLSELEKTCRRLEKEGKCSIEDFPFLYEVVNEYDFDSHPSPQQESIDPFLQDTIALVLGTLTEREAQVIVMRFGLDNNGSNTLSAIGKKFGVQPETIRQIEAKALRKLRNPTRWDILSYFMRDFPSIDKEYQKRRISYLICFYKVKDRKEQGNATIQYSVS